MLVNVFNWFIVVVFFDYVLVLGVVIYVVVVVGLYFDIIIVSKNLGSSFEVEYYLQVDKVVVFKLLMECYDVFSGFVEQIIYKNKMILV